MAPELANHANPIFSKWPISLLQYVILIIKTYVHVHVILIITIIKNPYNLKQEWRVKKRTVMNNLMSPLSLIRCSKSGIFMYEPQQ
jgi:hypothetical protein